MLSHCRCRPGGNCAVSGSVDAVVGGEDAGDFVSGGEIGLPFGLEWSHSCFCGIVYVIERDLKIECDRILSANQNIPQGLLVSYICQSSLTSFHRVLREYMLVNLA